MADTKNEGEKKEGIDNDPSSNELVVINFYFMMLFLKDLKSIFNT
jgi:hypothetical protein